MYWHKIQGLLCPGLSIPLQCLFHLFCNIAPCFHTIWQLDITCTLPSLRCYSLHMKCSSTSYRAVKILPILRISSVFFESSIMFSHFPETFHNIFVSILLQWIISPFNCIYRCSSYSLSSSDLKKIKKWVLIILIFHWFILCIIDIRSFFINFQEHFPPEISPLKSYVRLPLFLNFLCVCLHTETEMSTTQKPILWKVLLVYPKCLKSVSLQKS